jgi:hypothetical protein
MRLRDGGRCSLGQLKTRLEDHSISQLRVLHHVDVDIKNVPTETQELDSNIVRYHSNAAW